jgi:cystathionine gamma-synthase
MLQQPLTLGADIVYHSTTKFLNGHSDVVGGCVVAKTKELWDQLDFWANSLGLIGAPFDSYMTLRGLRTLELRVHRAQENALAIAEMLAAHPKVAQVYYPGLPAHEGHEAAKKQQEGFGAMLSLELKGDTQTARRFVAALDVFRLAQSLGGTESLINHPASMTHVSMGPEARAKAGVTDQLLRLSVGVEHIEDLLEDLRGALESV